MECLTVWLAYAVTRMYIVGLRKIFNLCSFDPVKYGVSSLNVSKDILKLQEYLNKCLNYLYYEEYFDKTSFKNVENKINYKQKELARLKKKH